MRILAFSLLLLISLGFSGCDSDKDENYGVKTTNLLMGTWKMDAATAIGVSTTTSQGEEYEYDFTSTLVDSSSYLLIFDAIYVRSEGNVMMELTTNYDGQPITDTVKLEAIPADSFWELSSGKRIFIGGKDNRNGRNYRLMTLSETALVLEFDLERTETTSGSTGSQKQTVTYVFSRSN